MRRLPRDVAGALAAAVSLSACAPIQGRQTANHTEPGEARTGSSPSPARRHCDYDVRVVRPTALLDVSVRCTNFRPASWNASAALAPFITDAKTGRGVALVGLGGRFVNPEGEAAAAYRIDLDRAAGELDDFDRALAIGASIIAPASSFLLHPEPAPPGVKVTVHVRTPPGAGFVTGLEPDGDGFVLEAHEVRAATYSVFGRFETTVLRPPGFSHEPAEARVAWLDGAMQFSRDDRARWVSNAVGAVADFFGGFPVHRALVAIAPIPGRAEVLHGKLLPAGGNAVAVLVGENATRSVLDDDWILVHELFHLGSPSFIGEGEWLDEGLATYEEPIIRARAGLLTDEAAWREVTRGMDRGRRLCETTGLENYGNDVRAVYWGGAVVSLLADVEARKRTAGARGLEDGLKALLARGGDARSVWRVDDAIRVIDEGIGTPVLAELASKYRFRGSPVPLDGVIADLGVVRGPSAVELRDDAPLAEVRRWITRGSAARAPAHTARTK